MSVRKHPTIKRDNVWQIDYRPNGRKGKRIYETFEGSFEAATQRHIELCLQHASANRALISPKIEEITTEYLTWLKLHRSAAYYKSMAWAMEKLRPIFFRHPVKNITPILFDEFKTLHKATPAHCNQCIDYLKAIIGWMIKRNYARPLPFHVEKLRHFRSIPQPPDPGEFDRFFEQVKYGLKQEGISPEEQKRTAGATHLRNRPALGRSPAYTLGTSPARRTPLPWPHQKRNRPLHRTVTRPDAAP